jgi:hypothetical protein
VRHASRGTLQIRTQADHALSESMSEHDGRRLGPWQHVPFTGSTRCGLGSPSSTSSASSAGPVRDRPDSRRRAAPRLEPLGRGARRTTIGTSEVGAVLDTKALPARKARRVSTSQVSGHASPAPKCSDDVEHESTEAGAVNDHANVSQDPGSANCVGSRAPPTVTVMHAPTGRRDGRTRDVREVLQSTPMRATGSPE